MHSSLVTKVLSGSPLLAAQLVAASNTDVKPGSLGLVWLREKVKVALKLHLKYNIVKQQNR